MITFCEACLSPLKPGDHYYDDAGGGVIHAVCFGDDPESFTDLDGEPLPPGAPIPAASLWSDAA